MKIFNIFKNIFKNIFGNNISQVQIGGNNVSQVQASGNNVVIINGQVISGNGVVYTGTRQKHKKVTVDNTAKSFSKIQVSGPFNISYTKSDEYGVNVDAPDEMLEKITIYVKNDTLYIEPYESFINKNGKINITVKSPVICGISLDGAAEFKVSNSILSPTDMDVHLTGAGDIDLKHVICKNITIKLSGAGDINATTIEAENKVLLNIIGAGDIDINKVKSDELNAKIVGAGDITILHTIVNKITKTSVGAGTINIH